MKESLKYTLFVVLFIFALLWPYWVMKLKNPAPTGENPFKKVGNLATPNGLLAEVFEFRDDCYVIVQSVPSEPNRAAVQMVCK